MNEEELLYQTWKHSPRPEMKKNWSTRSPPPEMKIIGVLSFQQNENEEELVYPSLDQE